MLQRCEQCSLGTSSVNTATAVPDRNCGMGSARDEGLILRSCAQEKSYGVSSKAMGLGSWMPGPENRKEERRRHPLSFLAG